MSCWIQTQFGGGSLELLSEIFQMRGCAAKHVTRTVEVRLACLIPACEFLRLGAGRR
jgi:hypothetical protein